MKRIILLLLILLPLTLHAQRQRNYIYIFDCTGSMKKPNNIWEPSKEFMKEDINQLDKNANVTIVLFHQDSPTPIQFKAKDFDWNDVESRCETLIKQSKYTGICKAWDLGLKYIDQKRNNYLYLFTDGTENVHPQRTDAVCERIRNWCRQAPNNYAFFVALGDQLKNSPDVKKLKAATEDCDRTFFIDDHQGPFGAFDKTSFNMNCHSIRDITVGFSDYGTFSANVKCNDDFYDVKLIEGTIKEGKAKFAIKEKKQLEQNHQIHFVVSSNPKDIHICNPDIFINIDTRNLRNIDFNQPSGTNEGQYDAGTAETYSSFLFWKEKSKDSISIDLGGVYNDQAQKNNCSMRMSLNVPVSIKDKCLIYYNGSLVKNGGFTISSKDGKSIVSIVVMHEMDEGEFTIGLKGISDNLETVNSEETNKYESSLYFKHVICWNPLKTIFMWTSIIAVSLMLLWFIVFKRMKYPRIRLSRLELSSKKGYYVNKKINGYRKVVISNRRVKQSFINKFFTGSILYIVNEIWTDTWELAPQGNKKSVRVNLHGKYMITPITSELANFGEYKLENIQTKEIVTIKTL